MRTTYDAEPTYHPCTVTSRDEHAVWWEGTLPVHNPVTNYRFLLDAPTSQRWLSAVGVVEHDPPDAFDFRLSSHHAPPDWARDAVVYQVFPDRFARSAAADERETPAWAVPAEWEDEVVFEGFDPRTPTQFYGGDLDGITEHLDHLPTSGSASSTRRRSSPARATTATTRRRSRRSTRCSVATRRTSGSRPPCTSAAGGSSVT